MSTTTTVISNRFQVQFENPANFIGQGGMGTVYLGTDTSTQTPVAVKVLKKDLVERDPEMLKRFQLEGQTLRQLNHPNIVKMLGSEDANNVHYLIMEYVSGGSLRDVLATEKKLSVQRALYIALDLADALTRAHRLDVLHRDIKPGNVLIAEDGTPRLTDFGMARVSGEPQITQDGAIVGTMAYLAPEAFQGEEVDERTDIWAFGVLLWEMLVGERPFPQEQPAPLIQAIVQQPLGDLEKLRSDLPTALVDLIYRMLEKNRQARIPSARLIGAELEAIIRGGNSTTLQPVISVSDTTGRFDLETTEYPAPGTGKHFVAPNNLQRAPTEFVGREQEIADLKQLIADSASLITLTGPGGIGKSRIAHALAETQLAHFEDGVYTTALEAYDDSSNNLVNGIGDAIGFSSGGGDPKSELLNYLREKHMLLVLDNFEAVMSEAGLISDLIANAPRLCIIVTSRERLRLRGEQTYDIDAMIIPTEADETVEKLNELPVAKLFIQSAVRSLPSFTLDDNNVADVAEIIRLVGGLPLGVELAAGWLEMLPIDEIVSEIQNSLDFLETDLRDVPERHRSLRAVADYSWNLLDETEREIFLKLSVFRNGFEREAAQKIAGASLRNLTNLVNKSLLMREPTGRYYVHKLLRQYGEERFKDHDAKMPTYMAYADYFITLAEKLGALLSTSKEEAGFDGLDKEIDNIRFVWKMGLEYEKYEKIARLQETFFQYYLGRSMLFDGAALFTTLAEKMEKSGRKDDLYWAARLRSSLFIARQGYYDKAQQIVEEALEHINDADKCARSEALLFLGNIIMFQGDYARSEDVLVEADSILDSPESWYYAATKSSLGYVYFFTGKLQKAKELYSKLMKTSEQYNYSPSVRSNITNNFGEVLMRLGDYSRALELFEESLELSKAPYNPRQIAVAKLNIAGSYFQQSDYAKAKALYEEGYSLYREIGDRWGIAQALSNLGNVAMSEDDHETAHANYNAALTIRRDVGEKRGIADSLFDLAYCAMTQNEPAIAMQKLDEAIAIRQEIGDKIGEGEAISLRGLGHLMAGDFEKSKKDLSQAQAIGEETQSSWVRAQSEVGLGDLALQQGDFVKAMRYFKMVLRENDIDEAPLPMILWALVGIAQIKLNRDDYVSALQIVTLILRYPPNYISIIEQRTTDLFETLARQMPQQDVESTLTATKSIVLRTYIAELLSEED